MSAMMKLVRACLLAALAGLAASAAQAEERPQDLVQAYNRAGLALFDALAREATNPVVSPYSIGTAMAMVSAGAQGDTAAQLAEVLAYPVGPGELATELP
ncbi:MAG: serpin family protein, partial [Pseudomonadota bacterium]|nr:serpin family protein [Pseudomonadota bacterium]